MFHPNVWSACQRNLQGNNHSSFISLLHLRAQVTPPPPWHQSDSIESKFKTDYLCLNFQVVASYLMTSTCWAGCSRPQWIYSAWDSYIYYISLTLFACCLNSPRVFLSPSLVLLFISLFLLIFSVPKYILFSCYPNQQFNDSGNTDSKTLSCKFVILCIAAELWFSHLNYKPCSFKTLLPAVSIFIEHAWYVGSVTGFSCSWHHIPEAPVGCRRQKAAGGLVLIHPSKPGPGTSPTKCPLTGSTNMC